MHICIASLTHTLICRSRSRSNRKTVAAAPRSHLRPKNLVCPVYAWPVMSGWFSAVALFTLNFRFAMPNAPMPSTASMMYSLSLALMLVL